MKRLALVVLTLISMACSDVTAPSSQPATMVFVAQSSCVPLTYSFFVDGQFVAERSMAAPDSIVFEVPPGAHTAGAMALEGFVTRSWFGKATILKAGDRYVARLGC